LKKFSSAEAAWNSIDSEEVPQSSSGFFPGSYFITNPRYQTFIVSSRITNKAAEMKLQQIPRYVQSSPLQLHLFLLHLLFPFQNLKGVIILIFRFYFIVCLLKMFAQCL
jgi:hypothetical protein